MAKKNLTILKTGHFETFAHDSGQTVSLGDVLRTTSLLRHRNSFNQVHWITSLPAKELIPQNRDVSVSFFEDETDFEQYFSSEGIFLNLERHDLIAPFLIAHQNSVIGFLPTESGWIIRDHLKNSYSLAEWNSKIDAEKKFSWNAKLFELMGFEPTNTLPVFEKPAVKITHDIGLNWKAGSKWQSKNIDSKKWEQIRSDLLDEYSVSWQQGFDSLDDYASWIASNRLLLSIDSLGLHLALAMNIPVVALFGPTSSQLVDSHEQAQFIPLSDTETRLKCSPCYLDTCNQDTHCSQYFPFKKVKIAIDRLLASNEFGEENTWKK